MIIVSADPGFNRPLTGGWGYRAGFLIYAPSHRFKKTQKIKGTLTLSGGRPKKPPMTVQDQVQMQGETSIFDTSAPRSIINLVPESFKSRMLFLHESKEKLFLLDEYMLKKRCEPSATTQRLKISFWNEYARIQDLNKPSMNMLNVVRGVCTREYFDEVVVNDPKMLAWIITPPKDYTIAMEELLDLGIDELREIITAPIKDPKTGKYDTRLMAEKIKAFALVEQRVKGAIVQKHLVKQQNVNLNMDASRPNMLEGVSLEELNAIATRLEGIENSCIKSLPDPRDVNRGEEVITIEAEGETEETPTESE